MQKKISDVPSLILDGNCSAFLCDGTMTPEGFESFDNPGAV